MRQILSYHVTAQLAQPKNQMRIRKKSDASVKTQLLSISSHVFQQDVKNLFRLLLV